jgi:BirA family transcriptional regulator, biotin operon repressor / biotin---[acetyl-CoA-carboxylase] ligase
MGLAPAAGGARLIAYEEIDSTNAEAIRLARAGETGPLWLTAKKQHAGRGRRGRTWVSQPGNLYATLLLIDPSPPDLAPQLSFVAALALHDAVVDAAVAIGPRLSLKWPNDMLCGGAKLAGILVEGEGRGPLGPLAVAIGIGVNCAHHPDGTDFPATDLHAEGVAVSPEQLVLSLSATMVQRLRQWEHGEGFATIRTDWLKRASGLGCDIRVRLPDREVIGTFKDVDASGRLLLQPANGGVEAISAGDVFPLPAVTAPAPPSRQRLEPRGGEKR